MLAVVVYKLECAKDSSQVRNLQTEDKAQQKNVEQ